MHKRGGKGRYFLSWCATKSDICVWWTCSWSQLHQLSACFNNCRYFWWSLRLMPGHQYWRFVRCPLHFMQTNKLWWQLSVQSSTVYSTAVFFPCYLFNKQLHMNSAVCILYCVLLRETGTISTGRIFLYCLSVNCMSFLLEKNGIQCLITKNILCLDYLLCYRFQGKCKLWNI